MICLVGKCKVFNKMQKIQKKKVRNNFQKKDRPKR